MSTQSPANLRVGGTVVFLSGLVLGVSWLGRGLIYAPHVCTHEPTKSLDVRYSGEIDAQALSAPLKALLDDAWSGRLVGRRIDAVTSFPLAEGRYLTKDGAVFLFRIPCVHTTVPHGHELWLRVKVDYRCNHVINCSMYDEAIPAPF